MDKTYFINNVEVIPRFHQPLAINELFYKCKIIVLNLYETSRTHKKISPTDLRAYPSLFFSKYTLPTYSGVKLLLARHGHEPLDPRPY